MLTALNENSNQITPSLLPRQLVTSLQKKKQRFFCPTCHEAVILKNGMKMIPHFSHYKKSNCLAARGEGPYHEQGKLQIYQWLKRQNIAVALEKHLPEINRRPDIYFVYQGKHFVIEYQCVVIPPEQLQDRTTAYQKLQITPIWILGEKLLKRKSTYHFIVDQFTSLCQHQWNQSYPPTLIYYCPITNKLIIVTQTMMINKQLALGQFQIKSLQNLCFYDLFSDKSFQPKQLFSLWQKEKRKFRFSRAKHKGEELIWRNWLYEKGYYLDYLPSIIYLPTMFTQQMTVTPWNWQSRLIIDFFLPLPLGTNFSIKQLHHFLSPYIAPTYFPLIETFYHPIDQYLQYLIFLRYVERVSSKTFRKVKQPIFHKHLEEALNGDDELLKRFMYNKP